MKVISESYLRNLFRKGVPTTFTLEGGQILTPSAAQLLSEKGVKLTGAAEEPCASQTEPVPAKIETETVVEPKYVSAVDGGFYETKPVHMTQFLCNRLVPKDHPRIVFRGRIETCQAELLLLQAKAHEAGKREMVSDLSEILDCLRDITDRELSETPLPEMPLIGLSDAELRDRCQEPEKHFGTGHFVPTFDMGELILGLNRLKALIREVEVTAVTALKEMFQLEKPDIVQALNRMSKALYIMMLKEKSGTYK